MYTHLDTQFPFIPPWVMGFLTICLIRSTNKTEAGGLLRHCNPTLEWVWAHETQTYPLRSKHVFMVISKKESFCLLRLQYNREKSFHSAGFHNRNYEPHLSSFLSSVSNLPIGPWATSLRREAWQLIFALEPFTVPPLLLEKWQSAWREVQLSLPGVLCLHPTPLWW